MTSPHPARFGRARLRATKRSALAAVAQHLLGPAATPYRAGSWSGHGELRWGAPSQKIVRELGAHKRSCPDLKRLTMSAALSPDLSEVRVQRRASVQCVSANPNEVRVRPLKRSGANLKRRASVQCVSANPNEVRVRRSNVPPTPELFSFFLVLT